MDLMSELEQAHQAVDVVDIEEGLQFEHLQNEEKCRTFAKALTECSKPTSIDEPSHSTTFNGRFLLTALFNNVHTPYADAVGTSNRKVVIISKLVNRTFDNGQQGQGMSSSTEGEETLLESSLISEDGQHIQSSFTVYNRFSIPIANSIKQKAVYMTKEEPFLRSTTTSLFLVDSGAQPISSDEAHHFCSLYALCCHGDKLWEELPDIWVLSQGSIVSMGCCLNVSDRTLNVYTLADGKTITVPDSNTYSISLDSNPFNKRVGLAKFTSSKKNHKIVTARYNFSPTSIDDDLLSQMSSSGVCITLDFIWSGKDACFSPPLAIAETVVGVSVTPGYHMSPVLPVYAEVSTLLKLCEISAGKISWESSNDGDDDEEMLQSSQTDLLSSKVKVFLEDTSTQMLKSMEVTIISPTVELSPFQAREDLDFLGQLWMFLRHVTNIEDLIVSLGAIFKAIVLGKIQPFIHQSKLSTLAVLFRQCLSCSSMDEREVIATKLQCLLTEEKALTCLVEIGVEKLQRDFTAFFTLGELATSGDLDVFFESTDLVQRCHNLCNLQYVLELATVLSTFISLPLPSLSLFVRDTLKYYRKVCFEEFAPSPTFNIYFSSMSSGSKTLIPLASSLQPNQWSVTIMEDHLESHNLRRRMFCLDKPLFKYISTSSETCLTGDDYTTMLYLYHVKHQSVNF